MARLPGPTRSRHFPPLPSRYCACLITQPPVCCAEKPHPKFNGYHDAGRAPAQLDDRARDRRQRSQASLCARSAPSGSHRFRRESCRTRDARVLEGPTHRSFDQRAVNGRCVRAGAGTTDVAAQSESARNLPGEGGGHVRVGERAGSAVHARRSVAPARSSVLKRGSAYFGMRKRSSSIGTLNSTFCNLTCATTLPRIDCFMLNATCMPSTV